MHLTFGEQGLAMMVVLFVTSNFIMFTFGTRFVRGDMNWSEAILNPMVLATLAGTTCGVLKVTLPPWLVPALKMLGEIGTVDRIPEFIKRSRVPPVLRNGLPAEVAALHNSVLGADNSFTGLVTNTQPNLFTPLLAELKYQAPSPSSATGRWKSRPFHLRCPVRPSLSFRLRLIVAAACTARHGPTRCSPSKRLPYRVSMASFIVLNCA